MQPYDYSGWHFPKEEEAPMDETPIKTTRSTWIVAMFMMVLGLVVSLFGCYVLVTTKAPNKQTDQETLRQLYLGETRDLSAGVVLTTADTIFEVQDNPCYRSQYMLSLTPTPPREGDTVLYYRHHSGRCQIVQILRKATLAQR